jgi:hypothetical protein
MKILLLFIVMLFVLLACEKDRNQDIDISEFPDQLIIGSSSSSSNVREINKVVSASLMTQTLGHYNIDIDGDSIEDLEFSASASSYHFGDFWSSGIKTLVPGIEIDVVSKTELYAKYSITTYTTSNDSITIYYSEIYNENKAYPSNLKIDTIIQYYPSVNSIGDTLNQSNNWKSGSFYFMQASSSDGIFNTSTRNGIWENKYNKFVGIRYSKANRQYYGWIEISVNGFAISLNRCYLLKP